MVRARHFLHKYVYIFPWHFHALSMKNYLKTLYLNLTIKKQSKNTLRDI